MTLRGHVLALKRQLRAAAGQAGDAVPVAVAADFLNGGAPSFARIHDRRGIKLAALQRLDSEPWAAFKARVRAEAASTAEARSAVVGGLPDGDEATDRFLLDEPPRGAIVLDTAALHASQRQALDLIRAHRRVVLIAGRRWGKSTMLVTLAVDAVLSGKRVGVFAPTRVFLSPLLGEIVHALRGVKGVSINRMFGEIRLPNGSHADFWSVDHTQRAGRGRKYHLALIDEAAHDEGYLTEAFSAAIAPTLLDYAGSIIEASTPAGVEPTNHFWRAAHLAELGFKTFHAPTGDNPFLLPQEIDALRATMPAALASQEIDAQFVDLGGVAIFPLAALLKDGQPVADDTPIDAIGMTIDSGAGDPATADHDGTAAVIFALRNPRVAGGVFDGGEVIILDWDIRSLALGGAAAWLRYVHDLYRSWVARARPRRGIDGIHIEKPGMGLRLLEVAGEQRIQAAELPNDWVMAGKDQRALMIEPHVSAGRVKFARTAYSKQMEFKGAIYNHALSQITGFRLFDRKTSKRADDLADAFMYAVLRCLGDGRADRWDRLRRVS
jgi:hypothetical protein